MPVLMTSRLNCSPLQEHDWPFFLALQQHPDVMRFVAETVPLPRFVRRLILVCPSGRRAARTGCVSSSVMPPLRHRWA